MHNLQSFVDKLNQLATNFQKKFNKAQQLSLDDMIKLLEETKLVICRQNDFVITTDPSGTRTIETIGGDQWLFVSQNLMINTDQALQLAKNGDCYMHIHLATKAVGSNNNSISGNIKLDNSTSQFPFGVKAGENIDINLPLTNIKNSDDFRVAIHNLSGFWQYDSSNSYIEVLEGSPA